MATPCTLCGTTLADDARYCKVCGTLVPSHPFSPASANASPGNGAANAQALAGGPRQSDPSPARRPPALPGDGLPDWMTQLEAATRDKGKIPAPPSPERTTGVAQPFPSHHSLLAGGHTSEIADKPAMAGREMRVKVWDQQAEAADELEDRPTDPLLASTAAAAPISVERNSTPSPQLQARNARVDELERLDTVRLVAAQAPAAPAPTPATPQPNAGMWRQADALQGATPVPSASVISGRRRKKGKPLLVALVALLVLLLAGGAAAWIVMLQPFAVPAISRPQQAYSDRRLGLSLLYPTSWQVQKESSSAAVHLFDSSHTDQVNIAVSPVNALDAAHYAQQQANRVALSAQKTGPAIVFAGTSWQQVRGSVLQSGANYSALLLVTVHDSHFFTLMFLAPQSIFAQEDQLVFARLRSSLQFIG